MLVLPGKAVSQSHFHLTDHGLTLTGEVTNIRDAGTFEVDGIPVRIANVVCAGTDTAAGRTAQERMTEMISGRRVVCQLDGYTSRDMEVGVCALASTGEDLGETLIREGICERLRENG